MFFNTREFIPNEQHKVQTNVEVEFERDNLWVYFAYDYPSDPEVIESFTAYLTQGDAI